MPNYKQYFTELEAEMIEGLEDMDTTQEDRGRDSFLRAATLNAIAGLSQNEEFLSGLSNAAPGIQTLVMGQIIGTTASQIALTAWKTLNKQSNEAK